MVEWTHSGMVHPKGESVSIDRFHPLVARWFRERFGEPTAPQVAGWRHIAAGVDTLIASFRGGGNRLTQELETFFLGAGVPKALLDALPGIVAEV